MTTATDDEPERVERQWAVDLFNHVWSLMDKAERTADDDAEMVHAAHASCLHWLHVGGPVNAVRGEWQCSRVYAILGRAEPARHHAERALALCQAHTIGDFDLAFAYEALARAAAISGDTTEASRWVALAHGACEDIAEADDKELVLADLATIPGLGGAA
ncbi:MAG: hypothetical protein QOK43_1594 [Acidimicrobiaceae bacterium]|nr:hypothetical protein [Acidimicrobiaceae bacterium]